MEGNQWIASSCNNDLKTARSGQDGFTDQNTDSTMCMCLFTIGLAGWFVLTTFANQPMAITHCVISYFLRGMFSKIYFPQYLFTVLEYGLSGDLRCQNLL